MELTDEEKRYLVHARVARLATANKDGRPSVVPICFALVEDAIVTALDDKPKKHDRSSLRRVRDIEANPFVAVLVDQYSEDWRRLEWVQVKGQAQLVEPSTTEHRRGVEALRMKYEQYANHTLEDRPVIRIRPGHVVSWGAIDE